MDAALKYDIRLIQNPEARWNSSVRVDLSGSLVSTMFRVSRRGYGILETLTTINVFLNIERRMIRGCSLENFVKHTCIYDLEAAGGEKLDVIKLCEITHQSKEVMQVCVAVSVEHDHIDDLETR